MTVLLAGLFILAGLGIITALWTLWLLIRTGVPFVKTPKKSLDLLLAAVRLSPADVVLDLGAGDGEVLAYIHKQTGASCIGYELSPIAFLSATLRGNTKTRGVQIHYADFFKRNLAGVTVIFCFLAPRAMRPVAQYLGQAQRGTRIVSYGFPLPDWEPEEVIPTRPDPAASSWYIYRR